MLSGELCARAYRQGAQSIDVTVLSRSFAASKSIMLGSAGSCLQEADVIEALHKGEIAGAALDVQEEEPVWQPQVAGMVLHAVPSTAT